MDRTTASAKVQIEKALNHEALIELMSLVREVPVASHVKDYAVRLVLATHPRTETGAPIASQYLRFGSSPRGGQALLLAGKVRALIQGRLNVSFDDIEAVAAPALRHPHSEFRSGGRRDYDGSCFKTSSERCTARCGGRGVRSPT